MHYKNFPPNLAFVSVYTGGTNNKFYPDETLEFVLAGKEKDNGEKIDTITNFDKNKHFETALTKENKKIATYLYKFTKSLDKDSVMIAKLEDGSKLMQMLKENQKSNTIFTSMIQNNQKTL